MITVQHLIKRFGSKTVLRGLDFEVQRQGEFVAILGPNGAGKTTFLRILASLSHATLGIVQIAGFSLPAQAAAVRSRLGVVTHLPLLYGDLTAEENLQFYGRMYDIVNLKSRIDEVWRGWDLQRGAMTWCGYFHAACSSDLPLDVPFCMIRR